MQTKITPNLWFDTEAEEAADFYTSVFENSRIVNVTHYTESGPRETGMVMTVEFELDGQRFVGDQRRPAVQVRRGGLLRDRLRDAGRDRLLLGEALRRRRGGPLRLGQGPIRALLAGRADRHGRAVRRSRCRASRSCDEGDARHAQARHRRTARRRAGGCGAIGLGRTCGCAVSFDSAAAPDRPDRYS